MTPSQALATEVLKHLVVWRCWYCKHDLHTVPDEPFGPCPACGKASAFHNIFSPDLDTATMLLTRATQASDPATLPDPEEQVERLTKLVSDLLALFWQEGHPGEPSIRTGWVRMAELHQFRVELSRVTGKPIPHTRRGPTAPDSIPGGL